MEDNKKTPKENFDDVIKQLQLMQEEQTKRAANDPDAIIRMLWSTDNPTMQQQSQEYLYNEAFNLSSSGAATRYKKTPRQKPNNFKKKAALIILAISLTFNLSIPVTRAIKNKQIEQEVVATLNGPVQDNKHNEYNAEKKRVDWWYDIEKVAEDVLKSNEEYDIDTRIYGAYANMNEYDRLTHMDQLFHSIQNIVSRNPNEFDEDVLKISEYPTFSSYLDAKGMTLEEYISFMKQVILAYGNYNKDSEEIQSLLDELNGSGTRTGGF